MLEWLKKILYEEEEDIVEESELEAIDFSHVEKDDLTTILEEKAPVVEEPVQEKKVEVVASEARNNFDIQISEEKVIEKEVVKQPRVRSERKEKDIEIAAVISPIFGGPKVESQPEVDEKKVVISQPKHKKDALGTVISPMYGQNELLEHQKEVEEKAEIEKKQGIFIQADDDEVSLEELIYNEEESDDCIQFSLFGEETKSSEIIDEE